MTTGGRLQGKVAIVTGGGDGFGAGIVSKFNAEGARVLVMDINLANTQMVVASCVPSTAIPFQGDVCSEADWIAAADLAIAHFGRIDIVVNNAGVIHRAQPSIEVTEEDYDRIFNVNVKSIYWSTKVVIPRFKAQGEGGVFINLSSTGATRPRPGLVWYNASKGAVTNMTRSLAIEWATEKIRFNALCPALGATNMTPLVLGGTDTKDGRDNILTSIPLGRLCSPSDVGNAASFLASDESNYLTGVCLDVDGGRCI